MTILSLPDTSMKHVLRRFHYVLHASPALPGSTRMFGDIAIYCRHDAVHFYSAAKCPRRLLSSVVGCRWLRAVTTTSWFVEVGQQSLSTIASDLLFITKEDISIFSSVFSHSGSCHWRAIATKYKPEGLHHLTRNAKTPRFSNFLKKWALV